MLETEFTFLQQILFKVSYCLPLLHLIIIKMKTIHYKIDMYSCTMIQFYDYISYKLTTQFDIIYIYIH